MPLFKVNQMTHYNRRQAGLAIRHKTMQTITLAKHDEFFLPHANCFTKSTIDRRICQFD
jgi:hypothetical protein